MFRNRISHALAAGLFTLVLAFGLALTAATPALAEENVDRQTAQDGIATMTIERVDNPAYPGYGREEVFKVTLMFDVSNVPLYGAVTFRAYTRNTFDTSSPESLQPTYQTNNGLSGNLFGGAGANNDLRFGGAFSRDAFDDQDCSLQRMSEDVTTITITYYASCYTSTYVDPVVFTDWFWAKATDSSGNETTSRCEIDVQVPAQMVIVWDDENDELDLRPTTDSAIGGLFTMSIGTGSTTAQPLTDASTVWIDSARSTMAVRSLSHDLLNPHGQTTPVYYNVTAPDNYSASATRIDATSGNPTVTFSLGRDVVTNGSLKVTLEDADSGAALAGATYELRDASGEPVATFTTDADGTFVLDPSSEALASHLPASGASADYQLVETAAPAGYQLDSTERAVGIACTSSIDASTLTRTRSYAFTVDGTEATSATFTNRLRPAQTITTGKLTVSLVDAQSGAALSGATYELRDASGEPLATFTTDADGTFVLDPSANAELADLLAESAPSPTGLSTLSLVLQDSWTHDFALVETAAPAGHVLDPTAHAVRVGFTKTYDSDANVTTDAYVFEVDGIRTEAATFENQPITAQQPKPQPAKVTVTPRTGDTTTSSVALAFLTAAGIGAVLAGRRSRRHEA